MRIFPKVKHQGSYKGDLTGFDWRENLKQLEKKRRKVKILLVLILIVVIFFFLIGVIAFCGFLKNQFKKERVEIKVEEIKARPEEKKVDYILLGIREVSAYNVGDENQCDGDPCIGASNKNLCELLEKGVQVCAANFLPFGTQIRLTGSDGWQSECVIEDRMNSRYPDRIDSALKLNEKDRAKQWGVQKLLVEIIK